MNKTTQPIARRCVVVEAGLVKTAADDVCDMCVHGQSIVDGDAKVTHLVNRVDRLTTNVQRCDVDHRQLLTCAESDEFSLIGIQFKPI